MESDLHTALLLFASRLPTLAPTLLGLGIAIVLLLRRRTTLGAAGRLGLLGFGLLALTTLASTAFYALMQALMMRGVIGAEMLQWILAAGGIGFAVLTAAAFVLLALAISRRPG